MPSEPPINPPPAHPLQGEARRRGWLAWLGEPRMWIDYRRKRFWVWVLLLTYVVVGYLVAPPLLRREIVDSLQQTTGRPVVLDELRIDPLVLSTDLRGFRINETDGSPLVGFGHLHIRFSLRSLLRRAWCFDDIRLEGVRGNVIRFSEGDTNIGRLIDAVGKSADTAKPEPDRSLPRLIVRRLSILDATADFTDHVPARPFTTTIGPATAEIRNFSTLPQETGEQHVQIALEGGASLEWTGQSGVNPLVSAGHVTAKGPYVPVLARYFADRIKLSVPSGMVNAELDYRLQDRPDGALALAVDHAVLALADLALREPGAAAPFLHVPEIRLDGGHVEWPEMTARAEALTVSGADVALRRQEDGRLVPWLDARQNAPTQGAAAPPSAAADKWSVALGKVELKKARARFTDHAVREAATIELAPIDLAVDALSNKSGAAFPFSLAMGVASGGTVKMQGRFSVLPDLRAEAKLTVADLRFAAAQAYLHEAARLAIEDGRLDGETEVKIGGPEGLSLAGRGEVRSLKLRDEVEKSPVLSWDRLGVDHFEYGQAANDLQVSQVTLGGPYLRFQVAADQSTNFGHLIVRRDNAGASAGARQGQGRAAASAPGGAAAPPMKVSVGKIAVAQGSADYGDASLPLPFAAHISDLQGEVASLSSAEASPARVTLRGQVGQFGQAKIDGRVTPFDFGRNTKVDLLFRNVEFSGLSPYTAKFAGRRIAQGRLDVDLHYAIDAGKLNGANRVVIRDIELGDKVDVPGARDLPLDLAIALLKDQDGKIDVDLPVSGNLNDPKFDIGSVISQAITNLLTNLVTAPFRALAGLLGGGEESLDHIDFAPGRAELDPPEKEKIFRLARALAMRPRLALAVPGVMDPKADRRELQLAALDGQMARDLGTRNTVDRQRQLLETLFEERIGKDQLEAVKQPFIRPQEGLPDAAALDAPAYVDALRQRVAKTEPVAEAGLASLAQARAKAVAGALKQVPGLDPRRITLRGKTTTQAEEDGVISLKLDAETVGNGG